MDTESLRFFFGHLAMAISAMALLFSSFWMGRFSRYDWQNWVFMALGLLVDTVARLSFSYPPRAYVAINVYVLSEAYFYILFARQFVVNRNWKKLLVWTLAPVSAFWLFEQFFSNGGISIHLRLHPLFSTSYNILAAFLYAWLMLRMVESDTLVLRKPVFWYMASTFFSAFCSYLLQALISDEVHQRIWFLNGIFNSITYILAFIGFLLARRNPARETS